MPLPETIAELIERFEANKASYQAATYNEAQTRQEFINPFFAALDWDVDNTQGFAEAYKDVVHEDAIKVGGVTKAPDYSFRIGGTRKFFLEAKKPSVVLKFEKSAAFQLRRYAWSAKLPLSILTNFAEFAVYDCRIEPSKDDPPSKARLFYYSYKDYAEKWDEIVGIFSKTAILKGSFDKFAESSKGKRGTAEVDAAFLAQIEAWRELLAKNLALRNPDLSQRDLNFAVQRTIDRIVFLRICEDRGMEPYGAMQALLNGTNCYPRLCDLFHAADERYNSGLFHFASDKARPEEPDGLTLKLGIDDKTLKDILRGLYYPDSPYVFSVIPADILGQAYEQFLGKVIRLTTGHRAVIDDKPEVKKAGGVYYTPTYIVDYIVRNTLGKLLDGKTPKDAAKLRVLDPACGSGSFLIGAFQFLLDWHRDWYVADGPPKHKKELYEGPGGLWLLTSAARKSILRNSIYGVDIDAQAVEVTKLSLLLKVLEGESAETLNSNLKLFKERALPDLGDNIKCGNSLIGPDFFALPQAAALSSDELLRINPFDWSAEFKRIMQGGGFDAVIGNPPYGAEMPPDASNYLKKNYSTFVWRGESYLLFVQKAILLMRLAGQFGYIIPDTYLNLGFTQSLRTYLLQNANISQIVSLPSKVFAKAVVDTTLLFVEKAIMTPDFHPADVTVKVFNKSQFINNLEEPMRDFQISTEIWHQQNAYNIHSNQAEAEIIAHIENDRLLLSDVAEMFYGIKAYQVGKGKPAQTRHVVDTKPFTSLSQENDEFLPFFDGKHIGRYQLLWQGNNWLKYGPWLAEPRQPEKYEGEKILVRKIVGETLTATYVPETSYCNTLLSVLKLKPSSNLTYSFVLGFLNSTMIGWYFKKKFQISSDDTFPQILIRDILKFVLPKPTQAKHDKMVALVETMLRLHKELPGKMGQEKTVMERQITATDAQIDKLVYELYGLTAEEIAMVEGAV